MMRAFVTATALLCLSAAGIAAAQESNGVQPSSNDLRESNATAVHDRAAADGSRSAGATPGIGELTSQLEALDQQVRILQRRLELEREKAADVSKTTPATGAGQGGFFVRSGDGNFQLKFRTLVHFDGRFFGGDRQDAIADTFVAQRVRPFFEATMFKMFDVRVTPDFGQGRTVLQDAYIDLGFRPGLRVRGGKFKSPFGLERLVSASELPFVDRALPTTVVPNRDIGIMVHGDVAVTRLSYAVGLFNGVADGASGDGDDRDGKDVVGRLFANPFRGTGHEGFEGLGLGVAASYGRQRGVPATPGLASYRTSGQVFFRYRTDLTGDGPALADGDRIRTSAQGYYYYGRFGILAEQVFSSQEVRRGIAADRIGVHSAQVTGSWVLTGEDASYRGVTPKHGFDAAQGTWGAFELVARFSGLTVDRGAFPVFADPEASSRAARTWGAGLNWYLNRVLKLSSDYERVSFEGGAPAGDRPAEHAFLSRIQFAF